MHDRMTASVTMLDGLALAKLALQPQKKTKPSPLIASTAATLAAFPRLAEARRDPVADMKKCESGLKERAVLKKSVEEKTGTVLSHELGPTEEEDGVTDEGTAIGDLLDPCDLVFLCWWCAVWVSPLMRSGFARRSTANTEKLFLTKSKT